MRVRDGQQQTASTKRLFIACPIRQPTVGNELVNTQKRLRDLIPDNGELRPEVHPHITLAFLGEIEVSDPHSAARVEALNMMLTIFARWIGPIRLILGKLGTFPGVVWCDVGGGTQEDLSEFFLLQKRVEHAVEGVGFPSPEHSFVPHITIGRFDKELTEALASAVVDADFPAQLDLDIPIVELMESVRLPDPITGRWRVDYQTIGNPHPLRKNGGT